ncbi:unnamed protein product [Protopolystoma xenopodis]|uniref:RING-type domain-containing protein n=1 Tax=Protopolystoma xenopodis TaxID=117903 RepID=A0A3S4ZZK0_9PLAT|nr:unnamed protein product [Protopolystoma xenopodis]
MLCFIEVFDTIMTQLLNQVPAGPPPATEAAISRLPRVHVSSDELAGKLERCSICFEDYAVGENLLRLPCQHIYHESCIVTWLKRVSLPLLNILLTLEYWLSPVS